MDVLIKRQATFSDLMNYCRHSANPVGRLILILFGYRDEVRFALSDSICTALQLANFWQDIGVDLEKNRIYIPLEDLARFGYSEDRLYEKSFDKNFQELLRFEVERTEAMFRAGAPLVETTGRRLGLELKCVVLGGIGICRKIRELEFNTLESRPHFKRMDKVKILTRAFFGFKGAIAAPKEKPTEQGTEPGDEIAPTPRQDGIAP